MVRPKTELHSRLEEGAPPRSAAADSVPHSSYRLTAIIGVDATGTLYRATLAGGGEVAIKALSDDVVVDQGRVASVSHANLLQIRDLLADRNGSTLVLLDLPRGASLAAALNRRKSVKRRVAMTVILRLLSVLEELHSRKIPHHNLNPNTIFLTRSQEGFLDVDLLFLGLSGPGALLNDVGYLPPEQTTETELSDPRTDIWTVGVLLYELLFNCRPFEGRSREEVIGRILTDQYRLPDRFAVDQPALAEVLQRALSRDPHARFADAAAMLNALWAVNDSMDEATANESAPPLPSLASTMEPLVDPTDAARVDAELEAAAALIVEEGNTASRSGIQTIALGGKPVITASEEEEEEGSPAASLASKYLASMANLNAMGPSSEVPPGEVSSRGVPQNSITPPSPKPTDFQIIAVTTNTHKRSRLRLFLAAAAAFVVVSAALVWWNINPSGQLRHGESLSTSANRAVVGSLRPEPAPPELTGVVAPSGAVPDGSINSTSEPTLATPPEQPSKPGKSPAIKMITIELGELPQNARITVDDRAVEHPITLPWSESPAELVVYANRMVVFKKTIVPTQNYIISFVNKAQPHASGARGRKKRGR